MTFIYQGSFHIDFSNITGHHRSLTISEIHKTLLIWNQRPWTKKSKILSPSLKHFMSYQMTMVAQTFDHTRTILLVIIFHEVAQNSMSFPCSEKSLRTPGFQVCGHPAGTQTVCNQSPSQTQPPTLIGTLYLFLEETAKLAVTPEKKPDKTKKRQELSNSWDGRPFGHNRHQPESGRGILCPFAWGELGSHLTQCRLGWGLPLYQVASGSIQSFGTIHQRHRQTDRTVVRQHKVNCYL